MQAVFFVILEKIKDMKKYILILVLILFKLGLKAQEIEMFITPIYQESLPKSYYYKPQMVTYCDYNTVSINFDKLLIDKLNLGKGEQKTSFSKDLSKGVITDVYTTKVGRNIKRIYFKYNLFEYKRLWVIKSVDITGDFDLLLDFYVFAYLNGKVERERKSVFTNYFLDNVFFQLQGNRKIKITRTQFKNIDEFHQYRERSKKEYLEKKGKIEFKKQQEEEKERKYWEAKKEAKEKRKIEAEKERKEFKERQKNYLPKSDVWIVVKSKKGLQIFGKSNERIKKAIEERMNTEKKGHYSVFIKDTNAKKLILKVKK